MILNNYTIVEVHLDLIILVFKMKLSLAAVLFQKSATKRNGSQLMVYHPCKKDIYVYSKNISV